MELDQVRHLFDAPDARRKPEVQNQSLWKLLLQGSGTQGFALKIKSPKPLQLRPRFDQLENWGLSTGGLRPLRRLEGEELGVDGADLHRLVEHLVGRPVESDPSPLRKFRSSIDEEVDRVRLASLAGDLVAILSEELCELGRTHLLVGHRSGP